MITNDELREEVRMLKVKYRVSYKAFAQANNIKVSSFYNWLRGDFDYTANSCDIINDAILRTKEEKIYAKF